MPKREFTALEINLNCVYRLFSADLTAYSNVFLRCFVSDSAVIFPPFARPSPALPPPFSRHSRHIYTTFDRVSRTCFPLFGDTVCLEVTAPTLNSSPFKPIYGQVGRNTAAAKHPHRPVSSVAG